MIMAGFQNYELSQSIEGLSSNLFEAIEQLDVEESIDTPL